LTAFGAWFSEKNGFGGFPRNPWTKLQNLAKETIYVRNHVSFHLKPVPSKNIENWRSPSILNAGILKKRSSGSWEIPYLDTRSRKFHFLNWETPSQGWLQHHSSRVRVCRKHVRRNRTWNTQKMNIGWFPPPKEGLGKTGKPSHRQLRPFFNGNDLGNHPKKWSGCIAFLSGDINKIVKMIFFLRKKEKW